MEAVKWNVKCWVNRLAALLLHYIFNHIRNAGTYKLTDHVSNSFP